MQIDSMSGVLTSRRLLDMSAVGTHSLRVSASDAGKPALTATCESTLSQKTSPPVTLFVF